MGILLGFAPFILFALLTSVSVSLALWSALAAAFAIAIRDFAHSPSLRMLDAGSVSLFFLLALYAGFIQPSLSFQAVRLIVDGGLLGIALYSLAQRHPFTIDYARDEVPEEMWGTPLFLRANYIITMVWCVAFAVMTAADALATFNREVPVALDAAAGLAALFGAVVFTARYPTHARVQAERALRRR